MNSDREDRLLLARLDERTEAIAKELHEVKEKFEQYVTQHQFKPVQLLVYGLASLMLTALVASLVASVVK